jgi:diguanylate cyclase (GGDEF)-like protein
MKMNSPLLNPLFTLENPDYFDNISVGLIIINRYFKIINANNAAKDILDCSSCPLDTNETCHHLFFQKSSPCRDCPCLMSSDSIPEDRLIKKKSSINEEIFIKEEFSFCGDNILITLHDMTKEISLLKTLNLTKKELKAKNVIVKQKYLQSEKELNKLREIFDHLPDLLVSVDSSFGITNCNSAIFKTNDKTRPKKCYEIMGHSDKCEQCPAEINGEEDLKGIKKSHRVDDKVYTEEFGLFSPGNGGMLIFRDTTRQIQLIEQIREQRELITKKNRVLSGLADLEIRMHREPDPKAVLEYFFDIFLPLYHSDAGAVIISDVRAGSIWFTIQKGLKKEQISSLSKAFISREVQSSYPAGIPKVFLPWENTFQFNLVGGYDRLVGTVLIKGYGGEGSEELIKVFKEPLGAFLQNRLLMRQLEEKANTDPLTGLYNRAYIDNAISEEIEKLNRFNIHFAVVMIDVNGLKKINDFHGHAAGDQLLLAVGKQLKRSVRNTDLVSRTGGDEFIILLTGTSDDGAHNYIERLDKLYFADFFIEISDQVKHQVTVSMGVAGTDKFLPEDLIRTADRFMYDDKKAFYSRNPRYR